MQTSLYDVASPQFGKATEWGNFHVAAAVVSRLDAPGAPPLSL
jgi:hypothetical protein